MDKFLELPLADRMLMLVLGSACALIVPYVLVGIAKSGFGNLRRLKVGNVEIAGEESQAVPKTHVQCARVRDVLHLLELQEETSERYAEIASAHAILSCQSIKAEMMVDGFVTTLLARLCEHERYEELARDFELMKFRLVQRLVLIFRENHLAEMGESEFLSHLRIRTQTATNTALLHIRADHPFHSVSNHDAVFEIVASCIVEAREIATRRKEQGKKVKLEFDEKKRKILGGENVQI